MNHDHPANDYADDDDDGNFVKYLFKHSERAGRKEFPQIIFTSFSLYSRTCWKYIYMYVCVCLKVLRRKLGLFGV